MTQLDLDLAPPVDPPPPRRRRSFHNNGGAPSVEEFRAGELRVQTQNGRLVAWFREHPTARLTRHDVAALLGCCEVSAGRALSDLAWGPTPVLRKVRAVRVEGPYGAACHPYELIPTEEA
jgi:hypothetical protein